MTTTDPITAHDAAEALREAMRAHRLPIGECRTCYGAGIVYSVNRGHNVACPRCKGAGIAGDDAPRWKSLLDRFDAQRREELQKRLDAVLQKRDRDMEVARKAERNWPRWYVSAAREENWQALRLRRELRRLESPQHIAEDHS